MKDFTDGNTHMPFNIAVVYSKPTSTSRASAFVTTDEDTEYSARQVAKALTRYGACVTCFPLTASSIGLITTIHADCIFNMIEWTGRDLALARQSIDLLEATGIPYTGSSSDVYQITADKVLMKQALDSIGAPTAPWFSVDVGHGGITKNIPFPVIVKVAREHCSIGMDEEAVVEEPTKLPSVVAKRLQMFEQPIVVESYISGREFHVTVLETPQGPWVLPPAEVVFAQTTRATKQFLTYESRWVESHPSFGESRTVLGHLDQDHSPRLARICADTFQKLHLSDYARFDTRITRDGSIYILEANSNPGLDSDPHYSMMISANAIGMTFTDFLVSIVKSAMYRFRKQEETLSAFEEKISASVRAFSR